MAKKSVIERNKKRERLVEKFSQRRKELKKILKNPETPDEAFFKAQRELSLMPRNSSKVRLRNRCQLTGRPRAYIGKFGVSRITIRELASWGRVPGLIKSSW
ncbi:MAG: 30S ribosomal protein S14 [Verrucomicrobia bacterium]|nr:MAG: 30S ribosomal protein S14 [Verrucomicrobiota bacterium]